MFEGAGVAIITPFKEGAVDFEAYDRLVDYQLENRIQALIVLGTTGEAPTINEEEREQLIRNSLEKAKGKVPVIVGTGSNNTETALKYTRQAENLGADGILLVTPYYNKATQNGLIAHFSTIAEATSLPVILYNVPGRTGVNIEPATMAQLARVDNIIGVKEASGNLSQILEIKRVVPEDFKIWSGNDDNTLPLCAVGGHGVISVMANIIPGQMQDMCEAFMNGQVKQAMEMQVQTKNLFNWLFKEVNPIPVKAALAMMNMIENELRLPLTPMEPQHQEELKKEMKKLGIIT